MTTAAQALIVDYIFAFSVRVPPQTGQTEQRLLVGKLPLPDVATRPPAAKKRGVGFLFCVIKKRLYSANEYRWGHKGWLPNELANAMGNGRVKRCASAAARRERDAVLRKIDIEVVGEEYGTGGCPVEHLESRGPSDREHGPVNRVVRASMREREAHGHVAPLQRGATHLRKRVFHIFAT